MHFVPPEFEPPRSHSLAGVQLEALGPQHNDRDHEAWMSSIDHIRSTPGFPDGTWPSAMTLDENMTDLEKHAQHFEDRRGFTYSVLDDDEVVGCLYIYPADHADADVRSWVRASRAELDEPLWRAISAWLSDDWPFESVDYVGR